MFSRIPVPSWKEIEQNYAAETRQELDEMVSGFRPGHGGRLLLWTGPPGTGKSYALRALAWEWRRWCSVQYISDPEVLFGAGADYLLQLLMAGLHGCEWRLLVLEDTGELLSADAKSRTGQGLSRLLNLVDGLIGQAFPTLVLVTTNEAIRTLHPAVARPGRCATHLEFKRLSAQEAKQWLDDRDLESPDPDAPATLAELYGTAERLRVTDARRKVGF